VQRTPQSSFRPTWKDTALSGLPSLFQREEQRGPEQSHIAELEQFVGRQTLELEIVNKSPQVTPWDRERLKMLPGQVGRITGFAQPKPIFPSWASPRASAATLAGENTPSEERLQ
jgi:hypothetical protein